MLKKLVVAMIALFVVTIFSNVEATQQTIEADGYYTIGDGPDENHSVAKNRAKMDAKRAAAEKAGIFVESLSEVKNGQLTRDEINTISAQILKIESEVVTPEVIGNVIRYSCHIVAKVDSSNVIESLKQDRQKLADAVKQNNRQQQELNAVKKELAELKERYKSANENQRTEINKKVNLNESKFTAAELQQEGYNYAMSENYHKAIEYLEKSIKMNPNNDIAWNNLGHSYNGLENNQKAKTCFERAIQIEPNDDLYWCNLGITYKALKNYPRAKECLKIALQKNFNNISALGHISDTCIQLKNYQEVVRYLEHLIDLTPNNELAWHNLGFAYGELGNYTKAIECYQRTLQINSKRDDTWNNLGYNYKQLGNYQKAKECYQKAIQINPNNETAWVNLSEIS